MEQVLSTPAGRLSLATLPASSTAPKRGTTRFSLFRTPTKDKEKPSKDKEQLSKDKDQPSKDKAQLAVDGALSVEDLPAVTGPSIEPAGGDESGDAPEDKDDGIVQLKTKRSGAGGKSSGTLKKGRQ